MDAQLGLARVRGHVHGLFTDGAPELGLVRVRGLVQVHVAGKLDARILEGRNQLDNGIALVARSTGLEVAVRVVGIVVPPLNVLVPTFKKIREAPTTGLGWDPAVVSPLGVIVLP